MSRTGERLHDQTTRFMNGASRNLDKATVPITWILAALVVAGGWWMNLQAEDNDAQDIMIAQNAADLSDAEYEHNVDIATLKETAQNEKLETRDAINEIKTQQALNSQILQQIADKLNEAP